MTTTFQRDEDKYWYFITPEEKKAAEPKQIDDEYFNSRSE